MPRGNRFRDYLMRRDMRNSNMNRDRAMRGDRAMDSRYDMARSRDYGEYESDYRRSDMARRGYGDMHHMGKSQTYRPVEAMGYFTGYYGGGQDMARGGIGRDRGYDMNYDYGYDYEIDMARGGRGGGRGRDYNADYTYYDSIDSRGRMDMHYYPPMMDFAGDYGEKLTRQEIEHWSKKLMQEVDDKDRNFFSKENIASKAKQMGIEFDKFSEDELALVALMMYTDYCKTLGTSNMDLYIRLAKDWICDEDVAMKYGEKIAAYHDCVVNG